MACDYSLIALWPFPEVFVVNATDVRAADRRSLYSEQNFSVTGTRDRDSAEFNLAVPRQKCGSHLLFHLFTH
jgi:hypothetical protein